MSRRYRILHVIDSFDLGGAQEILVHLATYADRTRIELEMASMHGRGIYFHKLSALGVPCHSLSPHKFFPLYIPRLFGRILRRNFDVVHSHLEGSNLIAKPIAAALKVPVVFGHDHSNNPARLCSKLQLTLDKAANRLATHVLTASESTRDFLIRYEVLPPERVSFVRNGIAPDRFTPAPEKKAVARGRWKLPERAIVVGGVGRFTSQKNFSLFLDVAHEILKKNQNAVFVLAGSGPQEKELRRQAKRLGDHVRFLGCVPEMAELYPALDILLMPSRFEGLPLTLLEAMAMEIPAVASHVDGIAEVVEDGVDGLLVEPSDHAGFVSAVLGLMSNPHRANQIGARAREKVIANFSAETMTREIERLYLHYLEGA